MVKVEEVTEFDEENDSDYETSSSVASDDDDNVSVASSSDEPETLAERLSALKDIIPPATRLSLSNSIYSGVQWTKWTGNLAGNIVWVVTTTALLIGLPMALAIEDESRVLAQEKEFQGQQQGQAGMLPPPSGQNTLVPPGF